MILKVSDRKAYPYELFGVNLNTKLDVPDQLLHRDKTTTAELPYLGPGHHRRKF